MINYVELATAFLGGCFSRKSENAHDETVRHMMVEYRLSEDEAKEATDAAFERWVAAYTND